MIDVARIDYWAANGSGPLHKASTVSKALFLALVLSAAVITREPLPLLIGYAILLVVAMAAGLPWGRIAVLSWYGVLFALLYGISFQAGGRTTVLLVLKAVTPALAMLMFIVSTPYPRVFSLLSAVLPEILAAGLFMTYRTLFILLDMMDDFAAAIRLRGGFSPGSLYKNGANISKGIGMVLVRAVERSSRLYGVMVARGYSGSMAERGAIRFQAQDALPIGTGALILLLALMWK